MSYSSGLEPQLHSYGSAGVHQLLGAVDIGVLVCGPTTEILLCNAVACSLLGLNEQALLGQRAAAISLNAVGPDHNPVVLPLQFLERAVMLGQVLEIRVGLHRGFAGDRTWLSVRACPVFNQPQAIEVVIVTLQDISSLHAAEAALQESEHRYQSLLHSIREVAFQIDSDGQWVFLNPAWTRLTGFTLQESIGQKVIDLVHPDDQRQARQTLFASNRKIQEGVTQELRLQTRSQGYRWFSVYSEPAWSETGLPAGITGTLMDVTERRQSEAQAAELSAKERAVGVLRTLIDYVSHDFRTPLSVVNAYLFLIRRKLHDEALVRSYLDILDQQAARLAEIVDDITTVSNLNYEVERFVFSLVDLNIVVREVLNNQEASALAKQVTVERQLAEALPMVRGDAVWLTRLVKNLLINALQHTGADGQITVRTMATADYVVLEVADTGAGIAPADLPYIFDYFYRADKTRPMHTGGAGLGLTIVQKIVEAHHGAIEVDSTIGQGSTFRIQLPRL